MNIKEVKVMLPSCGECDGGGLVFPDDKTKNCPACGGSGWAHDARIKTLEESLHYCNGVADLAMKHRDEAEARVAVLTEALRLMRDVTGLMINGYISPYKLEEAETAADAALAEVAAGRMDARSRGGGRGAQGRPVVPDRGPGRTRDHGRRQLRRSQATDRRADPMTFHKRLTQAVRERQRGYPQDSVLVLRRDLQELLHHFNRLDMDARSKPSVFLSPDARVELKEWTPCNPLRGMLRRVLKAIRRWVPSRRHGGRHRRCRPRSRGQPGAPR